MHLFQEGPMLERNRMPIHSLEQRDSNQIQDLDVQKLSARTLLIQGQMFFRTWQE
jgi:hypothetical protein